MYLSYDTKNFTPEDYAALEGIRGFSTRESRGRGDHYRGRVVSVNTLIIPEGDIASRLPEGYFIEESRFKQSAGMLVKICRISPAVQEGEALPWEDVETDKLRSLQRDLVCGGTKRAIHVFSCMVDAGIVEKKETAAACILLILAMQRGEGYKSTNILDIYHGVTPLKKLYFGSEKKKAVIQMLFDKIVQGQACPMDAKSLFDRIFLKGLCEYLGIFHAENGTFHGTGQKA